MELTYYLPLNTKSELDRMICQMMERAGWKRVTDPKAKVGWRYDSPRSTLSYKYIVPFRDMASKWKMYKNLRGEQFIPPTYGIRNGNWFLGSKPAEKRQLFFVKNSVTGYGFDNNLFDDLDQVVNFSRLRKNRNKSYVVQPHINDYRVIKSGEFKGHKTDFRIHSIIYSRTGYDMSMEIDRMAVRRIGSRVLDTSTTDVQTHMTHTIHNQRVIGRHCHSYIFPDDPEYDELGPKMIGIAKHVFQRLAAHLIPNDEVKRPIRPMVCLIAWDFAFTNSGRPYLLETNTRPSCKTDDEMYHVGYHMVNNVMGPILQGKPIGKDKRFVSVKATLG